MKPDSTSEEYARYLALRERDVERRELALAESRSNYVAGLVVTLFCAFMGGIALGSLLP